MVTGQALAGFTTRHTDDVKIIATRAFKIADAMIRESNEHHFKGTGPCN